MQHSQYFNPKDHSSPISDNRQRRFTARLSYSIITALTAGILLRPYDFRSYIIQYKSSERYDLASSLKKASILSDNMDRADLNQINYSSHDFLEKSPKQVHHVSTAPFFYHISPGTTGSRTLYHAACQAGFPSVHHKSFCISQTRGINGVSHDVVSGVRAHFEVLRMYQIAADCCSLQSKGVLFESVNNNTSMLYHLCQTNLHEWKNNLLTHLVTVAQSGLVGLFDTPYPYLAPQVLELAKKWRHVSPIVAMTARDSTSWAISRSKKHGLLLCREEYSYNMYGSSEFDVLGCISRAYNKTLHESALSSSSTSQRMIQNPPILHFWDVFHYRSHHAKVNAKFVSGMAHQMDQHQRQYLPLAHYTLNLFDDKVFQGGDVGTTKRSKVDERGVALEIRKHILVKNTFWQKEFQTSLKCRGRVHWDSSNDTFVELYHIPKTCAGSLVGKGSEKVKLIPLIPIVT